VVETMDNLDPLEVVGMADQLAEQLIHEATRLGLTREDLLQVVTIAHRLLQKVQGSPHQATQLVLEADAILKLVSGEFFVRH